MNNQTEKEKIIALLDSFISQRPGLEFGNYGDVSAYRSESRSITRDLHDARALLYYVARHDSLTASMLREAIRGSFSGRLTLTDTEKGMRLGYCTGQYFPTEYRRAACAVLSAAVWAWIRECCMPSRDSAPNWDGPDRVYSEQTRTFISPGDYIRKAARRELGNRIASRWFN